MLGKKTIPQWKIDEVNHLVELLNQHKNIAVINVSRMNDKQIQFMRKLLRGKAILRMSKKSLQQMAIEKYAKKSKKKNLDELANNIPGQASLLFSNLNIFEIKKIFQENEWMVPAKPNEITPVDIWVPAGDTGLPTGQVISELNMTLRLPTLIKNDTIWVREDTRTHKAGDLIDVKQAAVLKKLGITPLESLIKIYAAWADGEIISNELLYLDMEGFQQDIASCYFAAQRLAIELGILDKETIEPMIQKAHREALALLFEMPIFAEDMMDEYIKKAVLNANIINDKLLGEPSQAKEGDAKTKKDEPEDDSDGSPGIGGLFG